MTDLEEICEKCSGAGTIQTSDLDCSIRSMFCPTCSGKGKVPSEAGRELINFILRYNGTEFWEYR